MHPQWIIEKKRDGHPLSEAEIRFLIEGYTDGSIPDYQMAALAMAIFFRGMEHAELAVLTDAMMHSGDVVDTSAIGRYKADKHSTGGIGDKVSLILAPWVACCDIAVPMISGRGLGITGGTLDKMEAIAGYRTDLSIKEFLRVVDSCGCSIIGQTKDLAPADKKLYALRDVTGTVPSIPLIAASIMSKKLAEGTDGLVLDVKWGSGAFMKTREDARELARVMVGIGDRMDKGMTALLTNMDQPLGVAVGNSLEVIEAIDTLKGKGPEDFYLHCLEVAAHMLNLCGKAESAKDGEKMVKQAINDGSGLEMFRKLVIAQGGDVSYVDDPEKFPKAKFIEEVIAPEEGYVKEINARTVGELSVELGAGRTKKSDPVDHAVGVMIHRNVGDYVKKGDLLATIHANQEEMVKYSRKTLLDAHKFSQIHVEPIPLFYGVID